MDLSAAPSISPPVYKAKYSRACTFCRKKKVRCEGGYPCKQCADHDEICAFTGRRRFVRKPRAAYETVSARLGRLEGLINLTSAPREDSHAGQAPSRDRDEALLFQDDSPSTQAQVSSENDVSVLTNPGSEKASAPFSQLPQPHISLQRYERQMNAFASPNFQNDHWYVGRDVNDTHSSGFEPSLSDAMPATMTTVNAKVPSTIETQTDLAAPFPEEPGSQETSSLIADEMSNWEYNGPRCIMSICSQPAISWVESKVKMQGVRASILRFTEDITRRMKVGPESFLQSRTRAPEPTKDIAWLYTDVFFDKCFEADIGIVDSNWFRSRLTEHLLNNTRDLEDPSWYALRYTVFAFGCRVSLGKSQSFSRAVEASVALFENALSVQPDILQCRSSIISVRALLLMACFSEGIGAPHLEYMLASNAVRLAISKGLHRQPSSTWNWPQQEIRKRSKLFWTLYALDRQIASRSGRPPAIDDDEISCDVPNTLLLNDVGSDTLFTICIKLSQIQSRAYKRLSSARALRQSTEDLIKAVAELHEEVVLFKQSINHIISLDEQLDEMSMPRTMTMFSLIMIYFLYYSVLFDIHSPLVLPWFDFARSKQPDAFHSQVQDSCAIVSRTARAAILACRFVQLGANTPVLFAMYIPHRALILLFTHILNNPAAETAQSDLVLMEIASGFNSRLEFATEGSFSFPFAKEWVMFASAAVSRARSARVVHPQAIEPKTSGVLGTDIDTDTNNSALNEEECLQELFDPEFEVDMELWSTLVPVTTSEPFNLSPFTSLTQ